jgi:hypothetical protein
MDIIELIGTHNEFIVINESKKSNAQNIFSSMLLEYYVLGYRFIIYLFGCNIYRTSIQSIMADEVSIYIDSVLPFLSSLGAPERVFSYLFTRHVIQLLDQSRMNIVFILE